jgi:hypothetical protein
VRKLPLLLVVQRVLPLVLVLVQLRLQLVLDWAQAQTTVLRAQTILAV